MIAARTAVDGLASGAVIALMGLGVVIVYRSTRVLSFAQGALASLGAYLFFQFQVLWGWPVVVAFPAAIAAGALAGAGAERIAVNPLRHSDALTRTVSTLALVLAAQVLMRAVWGGSERFLPPLTSAGVTIGGERIGGQTVAILVATVVVAAALAWWFRSTLTGLSLAAMADEPASARLLGVSPDRVSLLTWGLASGLGALAGILATPLLVLNPWQMTFIMVSGYAAALVGGFASLPLTLAGGLGIGVVRALITSEVNVAGLSETIGFIAVFAVLIATRGRDQLADLLVGERTAL